MNGTEYEADRILDDTIFSDENLSAVSIDDGEAVKMILIHRYDRGNVTHFALREENATEKAAEAMVALEKEITNSQIALAEVYELIIGLQS